MAKLVTYYMRSGKLSLRGDLSDTLIAFVTYTLTYLLWEETTSFRKSVDAHTHTHTHNTQTDWERGTERRPIPARVSDAVMVGRHGNEVVVSAKCQAVLAVDVFNGAQFEVVNEIRRTICIVTKTCSRPVTASSFSSLSSSSWSSLHRPPTLLKRI